MKKYTTPSAVIITIETMNQLLQGSGMEVHDGMGDGTTGQLSGRRKDLFDDDDDW